MNGAPVSPTKRAAVEKSRGGSIVRRRGDPPPIDRAAEGGLRFAIGRTHSTPRIAPRTRWPSPVVDLAEARDERRLRDHQARLRTVLDTNRKALGRLFQTDLIFSRAGLRLGRDLLLGRQHLLRALDLLARLDDLGRAGRAGGHRDPEVEALYLQVQSLLVKTSELSARSEGLLARQR